MNKREIVLLASGTRGDVQPYLALGLGLQRAGYPIRIVTHATFREMVERYGLPFSLLEGNPSELMTHSGGQSALTYDGNPLRSLRGTLRFYQAARPLYERLLESAWQTCQGVRAIVAGLSTIWAIHIAEALGVPCIWAFLQPFSRTRAYSSALLPFNFSLGPFYNRFSHRLVEQFIWQPWRKIINRWRQRTLGLPPAPFTGYFSQFYAPSTVILYGYSPRLAPPPPDWPPSHQVTGYWFLEETGPWAPPDELVRFLREGPPPIYFGLGSPGTRSPGNIVKIVLHALKQSGLRAVLNLPKDTPADLPLPPWGLRIFPTPHTWLFHQVCAAVHHGGSGTTGASLRAGLPTLVLPLAIDQFFWGQRVAALGAGPRPLPQRSLTAHPLTQALQQLTGNTQMIQAAHQLGREISQEKGVETAIEVIIQAAALR